MSQISRMQLLSITPDLADTSGKSYSKKKKKGSLHAPQTALGGHHKT